MKRSTHHIDGFHRPERVALIGLATGAALCCAIAVAFWASMMIVASSALVQERAAHPTTQGDRR